MGDFNPVILWIVVFVIMIVVELITMGLTTIWFAGGAIVACIAAAADANIAVQIILFAVVSIVLMALIRPWAKKKFNTGRIKTNAQSLIGETAYVIETVDNAKEMGHAKVNGQEWTARNVVDEVIEKDTPVEIVDIKGVKLIVKVKEQ